MYIPNSLNIKFLQVRQLGRQLYDLTPVGEEVARHVEAAHVGAQRGYITSLRDVLVMDADFQETVEFSAI